MSGPRSIADPPDCVRRIELDGLTALFHRPSGATHILAPPAPQILDALAGKAGDVAAIIERMGERFELEAEDAAASIEARLAELEAAGLVQRLPVLPAREARGEGDHPQGGGGAF